MNHELVMHAYGRVRRIDFSPIRMKLALNESGTSWNKESIEEAELMYIAYLSIVIAYKDTEIDLAPPSIADDFWHQHILDTRKYFADCQELFGGYLHHYPYFGLLGPDDAKALVAAGQKMKELVAMHFADLQLFKSAVARFTSDGSRSCQGSCSSCKGCRSCKDIFVRVSNPSSVELQ